MNILAQRIQTVTDWEDLDFDANTLQQLNELKSTLSKQKVYTDRTSKQEARHVLFQGAKGTGKTLSAQLLGKKLRRDVYRIDLSHLVSTYSGETEKNLEAVFKRAESVNAILFFDEADALFGKRSEVKDSHDRYANQELAFLLERIESYSGTIIFSSRGNLDEGFKRRLRYVVEFGTKR